MVSNKYLIGRTFLFSILRYISQNQIIPKFLLFSKNIGLVGLLCHAISSWVVDNDRGITIKMVHFVLQWRQIRGTIHYNVATVQQEPFDKVTDYMEDTLQPLSYIL